MCELTSSATFIDWLFCIAAILQQSILVKLLIWSQVTLSIEKQQERFSTCFDDYCQCFFLWFIFTICQEMSIILCALTQSDVNIIGSDMPLRAACSFSDIMKDKDHCMLCLRILKKSTVDFTFIHHTWKMSPQYLVHNFIVWRRHWWWDCVKENMKSFSLPQKDEQM